MNPQELAAAIAEKLGLVTHVNAVFGESRVIGKKTIIPIAKVCMGLGAGGGEGKSGEDAGIVSREGSGGGGGGGGMARPLGVLEVTDEQTRLIPVIDTTRVIMGGICLTGFGLFLLFRFLGRRR